MRRTRNLLQGALRKLLQSKIFDDISVQDITAAATVNRATFYDHYTDKYALLEAMVAGGFHKLLDERKVSFNGSCASAAGPVVLAACDYLRECHSNQEACRRQNAFDPLIDAAIINAIRRVLLSGVTVRASSSAFDPEMIASTASWAIYGAVKQWFNAADRIPAEEFVPIVLSLVVPILEGPGAARKMVPSKQPVSA
jgi:AcrR family transcriptional regulator